MICDGMRDQYTFTGLPHKQQVDGMPADGSFILSLLH